MARFSRVRGPAADFELPAAFTVVPGFSITRNFGRGILLIGGFVVIQNVSGGGVLYRVRLTLDGVQFHGDELRDTIDNGDNGMITFLFLQPISPGIHTIEVTISGNASAGDIIRQDGSEFMVVELPAWDSEDDVTTL